MEQALEPADKLSLSDPQLGLARYLVLGERQGEPLKLRHELWRQPILQLLDGAGVDRAQPGPALLVQRSGPDFLEQLADHAAYPHDLGWLLDHLGDRALAASLGAVALYRDAV